MSDKVKKVLILGKNEKMKSSLVSKILESTYCGGYSGGCGSNCGYMMCIYNLYINDVLHSLHLWRIYGHQHDDKWKQLYKNSDLAIIVYDNEDEKNLYTNYVETLCSTITPIIYVNTTKNINIENKNFTFYIGLDETHYHGLPMLKILQIFYNIDYEDNDYYIGYLNIINNLKASTLYIMINDHDFKQHYKQHYENKS